MLKQLSPPDAEAFTGRLRAALSRRRSDVLSGSTQPTTRTVASPQELLDLLVGAGLAAETVIIGPTGECHVGAAKEMLPLSQWPPRDLVAALDMSWALQVRDAGVSLLELTG